MDKAVSEHVVFVKDRLFNDLRYPLNCKKLVDMGWGELTSWAEGLDRTLQWYTSFSSNWDDVESALVPHPRRGLLPSQLAAAAAAQEPPAASPLDK